MLNNLLNMMLQNMISQNPSAFNKAREMCNGKSEDEMKQVFLNLAQTQGKDMNEIRQMCSMFGINI